MIDSVKIGMYTICLAENVHEVLLDTHTFETENELSSGSNRYIVCVESEKSTTAIVSLASC